MGLEFPGYVINLFHWRFLICVLENLWLSVTDTVVEWLHDLRLTRNFAVPSCSDSSLAVTLVWPVGNRWDASGSLKVRAYFHQLSRHSSNLAEEWGPEELWGPEAIQDQPVLCQSIHWLQAHEQVQPRQLIEARVASDQPNWHRIVRKTNK